MRVIALIMTLSACALGCTEAFATWTSSTVCRTGSTSVEGGAPVSQTVCWGEATWTDDYLMDQEDPIAWGDVGAGDVQYYYDSDVDGRMDCWKDTTTSATNNSPYGQSSWRFHYGTDIGSVLPNFGHGAPVRAIASGQVIAVGSDAANGNFIRILHTDGMESVYAHLLDAVVVQGAYVLPGYDIGTMNCTGSCTSSVHGNNAVQDTHLHLEIKTYQGAPRTPENRVDPESLMSECG